LFGRSSFSEVLNLQSFLFDLEFLPSSFFFLLSCIAPEDRRKKRRGSFRRSSFSEVLNLQSFFFDLEFLPSSVFFLLSSFFFLLSCIAPEDRRKKRRGAFRRSIFSDIFPLRSSFFDRGSLSVFLSVMTRSQALNRLRSAKSQQQLIQRFGRMAIPESGENPNLDRAALMELSQRVNSALKQLPEAQRQVLELAYYEGFSQSDITEKTGVPLGTVKSRSRQGLLKLRELLKDLAD
jgi:RNA polymerase sigma factor (sigma-70 family)